MTIEFTILLSDMERLSQITSLVKAPFDYLPNDFFEHMLIYSGGLLSSIWMSNRLTLMYNGMFPRRKIGFQKRFLFVCGMGVVGVGMHLWYSQTITRNRIFLQHAAVGAITPMLAFGAAIYTVEGDSSAVSANQ